MTPPKGIRAALSLRQKNVASSIGSRSGDVTRRKVVPVSESSALTAVARSLKPSIIPPRERKKTDRS